MSTDDSNNTTNPKVGATEFRLTPLDQEATGSPSSNLDATITNGKNAAIESDQKIQKSDDPSDNTGIEMAKVEPDPEAKEIDSSKGQEAQQVRLAESMMTGNEEAPSAAATALPAQKKSSSANSSSVSSSGSSKNAPNTSSATAPKSTKSSSPTPATDEAVEISVKKEDSANKGSEAEGSVQDGAKFPLAESSAASDNVAVPAAKQAADMPAEAGQTASKTAGPSASDLEGSAVQFVGRPAALSTSRLSDTQSLPVVTPTPTVKESKRNRQPFTHTPVTSLEDLAFKVKGGKAIRAGKDCWVLSHGTVNPPTTACCTKRMIFPHGFLSVRSFQSYKSIGQSVLYVCEVSTSTGKPLFRVHAMDDPAGAVIGCSPSAAWHAMIQRLKSASGKGSSKGKKAAALPSKAVGMALFGLAYPSVQQLIRELPSAATRCKSMEYFGKKTGLESGSGVADVTYMPWTETLKHLSAAVDFGAGGKINRGQTAANSTIAKIVNDPIMQEANSVLEKEMALLSKLRASTQTGPSPVQISEIVGVDSGKLEELFLQIAAGKSAKEIDVAGLSFEQAQLALQTVVNDACQEANRVFDEMKEKNPVAAAASKAADATTSKMEQDASGKADDDLACLELPNIDVNEASSAALSFAAMCRVNGSQMNRLYAAAASAFNQAFTFSEKALNKFQEANSRLTQALTRADASTVAKKIAEEDLRKAKKELEQRVKSHSDLNDLAKQLALENKKIRSQLESEARERCVSSESILENKKMAEELAFARTESTLHQSLNNALLEDRHRLTRENEFLRESLGLERSLRHRAEERQRRMICAVDSLLNATSSSDSDGAKTAAIAVRQLGELVNSDSQAVGVKRALSPCNVRLPLKRALLEARSVDSDQGQSATKDVITTVTPQDGAQSSDVAMEES